MALVDSEDVGLYKGMAMGCGGACWSVDVEAD